VCSVQCVCNARVCVGSECVWCMHVCSACVRACMRTVYVCEYMW